MNKTGHITRILIIQLLWLLLLVAGCSSSSENGGPVIEGTVTVDPEIDPSGDYSGIELLGALTGPDGAIRDTLYFAETDSNGRFYGKASIDRRGIYPVFVSRNNNRLGLINLVLAKGDTVHVEAELPNLNQTASIESEEQNAFRKFERLQKGFNRVASYVNNVGLSADSLEMEITKWSELFWDFYRDNPSVYAGEQSAAASISLLMGWDNDLMLSRTDTLLNQMNRLPRELREQLTNYHAQSEGLDRSLTFLNRLQGQAETTRDLIAVRKEKIELLFDSARTDTAQQLLEEFEQEFANREQEMAWAENMSYDLEILAPGRPFPDFSFLTTDGDSISSQSLSGSPYMVEIARFDSPLYQQQYEQTVAIAQIYKTYGLTILTVPVATSDTALRAFFEERTKLWQVAAPGTFDTNELASTYNVQQLPTRFLMNDQGKIIQRYTGAEYDNVVQGLQNILTQEQIES